MKAIRRSAIAGMLILSMMSFGCGPGQINKVVNLLNATPDLVRSFHLPSPTEANILVGIKEGTAAVIVFRDNPTRGNLRNALAVFQSLVDRGVFKTGNPSVDSRLGAIVAAAIFIMNTINPPESMGGVDDSNAKVEVTADQKSVIDAKIREMETLVKGP